LEDAVVACTGHYYAMGPPDDPSVTIDRLLHTDPRIDAGMSRIMPATRDARLPFRMTEGNSCYRGGKPGVSDAFVSALWGGDYMLHLARLGCAGVNFHGGGARQIRAALGDHLPGAASAKNAETPRSGTYYTPIAGSPATGNVAQPVFYGMLLANRFAGSILFECEIEPPGVNVTAYAANMRDGVLVALFNKDATQDLLIGIPWNHSVGQARVWHLTAPALDATTGVTLAGAEIHAGIAWHPQENEAVKLEGDRFRLHLPHASAALVRLSS
jgi:hypothetical protein